MKTRLKKALSLALTALMTLMLAQGALAAETEVLPATEDAVHAGYDYVSDPVVPGAANDDSDAEARAAASYKIAQGSSLTVDVSIDVSGQKAFTFDSEQAGITAARSSNRTKFVVSVDDSVPVGAYELVVKYYPSGSGSQTTDTLTIIVTEGVPESAQVYYLKTPTSDPDSNDTSEWGDLLGVGTVNTAGATWKDNKNIFNPGSYVRGMPSKMEAQGDGSWKLTKADYPAHFTAIFNAYKTKLEEELHVTLTEEDIEAIYLTPYKISKNNRTNPDKHIDCTISVKTKKTFSAAFLVDFPDGNQKQAEANNYLTGQKVEKTAKAPTGESGDYPETMTVGGVGYTFDGWYNESGEKVIWDEENKYQPSEAELADGKVNFYAHYNEKQVTIYYVAVTTEMGKVSVAEETLAMKSGEAAGSTAAANPYYRFVGWYEDDECTKLLSQDEEYVPTKAAADVWADGTTYYAKFEEAKVKIQYVPVTADMGKVDSGSEEVKVLNGPAEGSTPAAKATYKFVGWFTDEECQTPVPVGWVGEGGKITPQKETIAEGVEGYQEATYYAKFEKDSVSLTVTKAVAGNFGDKSKAFAFSMKVADGNGYDLTVGGKPLEMGNQSDYIFSLNDGGSIKIDGIPAGTKIALAETNAEKYVVSFNDVPSATRNYVRENGLDADTVVRVENKRDTSPDTGVLLDSLPYILIIACAAAIGAFILIRRRKNRED